ncbi:MAG: molybdopterin molybdenumtransferase MoeA [Clostridia bacterium]|nr:molybdopterin molybdenumtransferase MoeA [Clostridia bacterium]
MLNVISLAKAKDISAALAKQTLHSEVLPLNAITGRVAAEDIYSPGSVPAFSRSTMDGYAVFAADTFGAGETCPCELTVAGEVKMGEKTETVVVQGTCVKIPTGGMLPEGADAVVPVEYADSEFGSCLFYKGVSPFENVTRAGDDVKENELLLPAGTLITSAKTGVLAAAGVEKCSVLRRPRAGIISTGNEIVPVGESPAPGKVRDVNSHLLSSVCEGFGFVSRFYGIVPDAEEALKNALSAACAENDMVLLSGGSSAGERDLTAKILSELGSVAAHGIAVKPGKPTVIGSVNSVPVFGLPGHPAACYFVADTVVRACAERIAGAVLPRRTVCARLGENVSSNHGREEFVCVALEKGLAVPVYAKSGVVSQLSRSDGYFIVPRNSEGLRQGELIDVYLF